MNREQWLNNTAQELVPTIETIASKKMPNFDMSVGFPSRNGLSIKKRVIGQCWNKAVCVNGVHQIFISPMLGDPMEVIATVAHELVHAIVGVEAGHRKPFTQVIRPLGLEGKATATYAGDKFKSLVSEFIEKIGEYPHKGMVINSVAKAAGSPLIKAQCPEDGCGYKVRITNLWIQEEGYGAPICPKHNIQMEIR